MITCSQCGKQTERPDVLVTGLHFPIGWIVGRTITRDSAGTHLAAWVWCSYPCMQRFAETETRSG
jgi:hypothetical protein